VGAFKWAAEIVGERCGTLLRENRGGVLFFLVAFFTQTKDENFLRVSGPRWAQWERDKQDTQGPFLRERWSIAGREQRVCTGEGWGSQPRIGTLHTGLASLPPTPAILR